MKIKSKFIAVMAAVCVTMSIMPATTFAAGREVIPTQEAEKGKVKPVKKVTAEVPVRGDKEEVKDPVKPTKEAEKGKVKPVKKVTAEVPVRGDKEEVKNPVKPTKEAEKGKVKPVKKVTAEVPVRGDKEEVKDSVKPTQKPKVTPAPTKEAQPTKKPVTKRSKKLQVKVKAQKKKATLKWEKEENAVGYEIYRATSKNGKYKKVKTITDSDENTYTNKNLKPNKKYYYKVRSFQKVNGKKIYGTFSTVKCVKTK